ncbi:unnamed protein product [Leptosia nina]|uniref:Ciliary microtubule inner protein 2A-C-like domain-containing protein n=1 Tax=Leptosia nina TaxID=320188 RepID=A0AAV1JFN1_9NEOP
MYAKLDFLTESMFCPRLTCIKLIRKKETEIRKYLVRPKKMEVLLSIPDPPLSINPTEIYHKHVGMLPNYAGHVPGCLFRFGKTYGNDTRDAKRWLRGDFKP